ncbi:MAG: prephenate dehydrogenase [Eubacteriales bacterium]
MTIGIVGLGLIGGSIAKAIKENTDNTVLGFDIAEPVIFKAKLVKAIDGELTVEKLHECDILIIALYFEDTIKYIRENAANFKKGGIVIDCCGVKKDICAAVKQIAVDNNFIFVGGHPMAGIEFSGFEYSKKNLFEKASMIIAPYPGTHIEVIETLKKLFLEIGFNNFQITTPEEHDKMIAFTSQLAHVVSSAYVKSPAALNHKGFSAGSYKDMTRVAKLNEKMWTELFLSNRENLISEIDSLTARLNEYSEALKNNDAATMNTLLREGRERKQILNDE